MKKRPKSLEQFIEWLDEKKYVGTQRRARECPIAFFWREKTGTNDVRVDNSVSIGGFTRKKYIWEKEVMEKVDTFEPYGQEPYPYEHDLSAKDVKNILISLCYMEGEK